MLMRLLLLLLILCPSSLWAAGLENQYGVWSGTLTEMVVAGRQYRRYEVTLSLSPQDYEVDYPSLGCGGQLHLLKYAGRHWVFRDALDYGLDQCANGGRTELRIIGPGLCAFQWFDRDGVLKVEGLLKRQKQLMVLRTAPDNNKRG